MSFNGSGTFVINSTGQPVVASTVISSTVFNAFTADIATGLTNCITKDGQQTITADIPWNSKKITGLAAATATGDALSLGNMASLALQIAQLGLGMSPSAILDATQTQNGTSLFQLLNASAGTSASAKVRMSNGTDVGDFALTGTGFSGIYYTSGRSGANLNIGSQTLGMTLGTVGVAAVNISGSQALQFPHYGAGTLTTDASGNVSVSSDPALKNKTADFTDGLTQIQAIAANIKYMGMFQWKPEAGMDDGTYASFFAYDDFPIAAAISKNKDGVNSFNDRPVIMALVNAIDEIGCRLKTAGIA